MEIWVQGNDIFRFGGTHKTRAGVAGVTSNIAMDYTFRFFAPRDIVGRGDSVWSLFDAEMVYNLPPKVVTLEIAVHWLLNRAPSLL